MVCTYPPPAHECMQGPAGQGNPPLNPARFGRENKHAMGWEHASSKQVSQPFPYRKRNISWKYPPRRNPKASYILVPIQDMSRDETYSAISRSAVTFFLSTARTPVLFYIRRTFTTSATLVSTCCSVVYAHVAMPIECLDSRQQLVVVPDVNEHLCVCLDALQSHHCRRNRGATIGAFTRCYKTSCTQALPRLG